jgi:hypothetical protein
VFEKTSVVFAEIGEGRSELMEMHAELNQGSFAANEQFEYYPHITLAQGILSESLAEVHQKAERRWKESAPYLSFVIDTLTFVQNTLDNRWVDLVDVELRGEAALLAVKRSRRR